MTGRITVKPQDRSPFVQVAPGIVVERDVLGIVQEINEQFPNLRVQFLDPDKFPELTDAPYQIIEKCPDGVDRLVCQVWKLDHRLIDRLHKADTYRLTRKMDLEFQLEEHNAKVREEEKKKSKEKSDAITEMVADVIGSPKDTYKATNPVTGEKHTFTSVRQEKK